MRNYEITFFSIGPQPYPKRITALATEPDRVGPNTGVLICTHGWGGNRFAYQDTMRHAADLFDLVCISAEFRGSGYESDPVKGNGWELPYDLSFYQTFDVLNGLRAILELRPGLNRRRLMHYGGSQGGHIALLSAIFAPATFAFVYATAPLVRTTPAYEEWAGRRFWPHEQSVRNVLEHADRIRCRVVLEHGTADIEVPHDQHSVPLAEKLRSLGRCVTLKLHEGGTHSLAPVTTRLETFKATAPEFLRTCTTDGRDDFAVGSVIEIPCADRTLRIDWSKPAESHELVAWR